MALLELQQIPQTLIFPDDGVGQTGVILDLGNLLLELFVFGSQGFVAEHITVKLFGPVGKAAGGGPQGLQNCFGHHFRKGGAGDTADDDQCCGKQYGHNQNDPDFGGEKVLHANSSMISGATLCRSRPSRHRGSPTTL